MFGLSVPGFLALPGFLKFGGRDPEPEVTVIGYDDVEHSAGNSTRCVTRSSPISAPQTASTSTGSSRRSAVSRSPAAA